ncbi:hypothetical protein A3F03_04695 [Candidatus Roizmanbacteria bacterium RIFCSPHIGHO2_12_FULL_41_11]|uniref:histidine kinase n=3 Tax=Candidatus Roizmaniibacteriota TaxID=1752723 RepID=A0A1F7JS58_9BACT|nr:MAG: hypothetical protein A3F03_04695 [Candidatus Roizmanbacteria bacterium RIFCSPHIGHO2_12_FULL_41_11]OGK51832.1 MAG: hypothetical protein A2966_00425 [Candidatus Roizmanbacteria bacterium RIFCSPLOWO2_01_FULL_41_22]OGK58407.1 MAG: hypothetical protein A3H86_04210 [Candidatus Roizmanbacteria bacterium RIFCSPLOWO2_02_FULL_41_9]
MKKLKDGLRYRLFFWYILNLLFLGFFIILTIHIYRLPYSNFLLITVFLILSIIGFIIIDSFTKSLIFLASRMKLISSKNLDELIEIGQKLAFKKQIKITHSIVYDIKMKGFRDRLGMAILNIIENTIKYTPDHGKVHISLLKEQNNALIAVKDNGQGIEESELDQIFDRFYLGSKKIKYLGQDWVWR